MSACFRGKFSWWNESKTWFWCTFLKLYEQINHSCRSTQYNRVLLSRFDVRSAEETTRALSCIHGFNGQGWMGWTASSLPILCQPSSEGGWENPHFTEKVGIYCNGVAKRQSWHVLGPSSTSQCSTISLMVNTQSKLWDPKNAKALWSCSECCRWMYVLRVCHNLANHPIIFYTALQLYILYMHFNSWDASQLITTTKTSTTTKAAWKQIGTEVCVCLGHSKTWTI